MVTFVTSVGSLKVAEAERVLVLTNGEHRAVKKHEGEWLTLCIVGPSVFQYAILDDFVEVVYSPNGAVKGVRARA